MVGITTFAFITAMNADVSTEEATEEVSVALFKSCKL